MLKSCKEERKYYNNNNNNDNNFYDDDAKGTTYKGMFTCVYIHARTHSLLM